MMSGDLVCVSYVRSGHCTSGQQCRLAHPALLHSSPVDQTVPLVVPVTQLRLVRAMWPTRWWIDVRIVARESEHRCLAQCVHSVAKLFIYYKALPAVEPHVEKNNRQVAKTRRAALSGDGVFRISGGVLARLGEDALSEIEAEVRDARRAVRLESFAVDDDYYDDDFYGDGEVLSDTDDEEDEDDDEIDGEASFYDPSEDAFFMFDALAEAEPGIAFDADPLRKLSLFLTAASNIVRLPKVMRPPTTPPPPPPAPSAPQPAAPAAPAAARVASTAPAAPACKFFANGRCTKGKACRFSHTAAAAAAAVAAPAPTLGRAPAPLMTRANLIASVQPTQLTEETAASESGRLLFPLTSNSAGAAFTRAEERKLREIAFTVAARTIHRFTMALRDQMDAEGPRGRLEREFVVARFAIECGFMREGYPSTVAMLADSRNEEVQFFWRTLPKVDCERVRECLAEDSVNFAFSVSVAVVDVAAAAKIDPRATRTVGLLSELSAKQRAGRRPDDFVDWAQIVNCAWNTLPEVINIDRPRSLVDVGSTQLWAPGDDRVVVLGALGRCQRHVKEWCERQLVIDICLALHALRWPTLVVDCIVGFVVPSFLRDLKQHFRRNDMYKAIERLVPSARFKLIKAINEKATTGPGPAPPSVAPNAPSPNAPSPNAPRGRGGPLRGRGRGRGRGGWSVAAVAAVVAVEDDDDGLVIYRTSLFGSGM